MGELVPLRQNSSVPITRERQERNLPNNLRERVFAILGIDIAQLTQENGWQQSRIWYDEEPFVPGLQERGKHYAWSFSNWPTASYPIEETGEVAEVFYTMSLGVHVPLHWKQRGLPPVAVTLHFGMHNNARHEQFEIAMYNNHPEAERDVDIVLGADQHSWVEYRRGHEDAWRRGNWESFVERLHDGLFARFLFKANQRGEFVSSIEETRQQQTERLGFNPQTAILDPQATAFACFDFITHGPITYPPPLLLRFKQNPPESLPSGQSRSLPAPM